MVSGVSSPKICSRLRVCVSLFVYSVPLCLCVLVCLCEDCLLLCLLYSSITTLLSLIITVRNLNKPWIWLCLCSGHELLCGLLWRDAVLRHSYFLTLREECKNLIMTEIWVWSFLTRSCKPRNAIKKTPSSTKHHWENLTYSILTPWQPSTSCDLCKQAKL